MASNEPTAAVDAASDATFVLRDCALIAIATSRRAFTLREFRDNLAAVTEDSIYYHFWGSLLQPRFEEREYNNDFASWVRHGLHDGILAEKLAVIDPTDFPRLEDLRQTLLEHVEERLDQSEYLQWARASHQFEFIRSQIVVFDTHHRVSHPDELNKILPHLSPGSIFYHFIDARRRSPEHKNDFRTWLEGFAPQYDTLCSYLADIDPYFSSMTELRQQLSDAFARALGESS